MSNIDQLRHRQEQRLLPVLKSWDDAKKHLEEAIALAETRERDFRAVSEDVQRKLDALDLVIGMAKEFGDEAPPEISPGAEGNRPVLMLPENAHGERKAAEAAETSVQIQSTEPPSQGLGGLFRRSSRPLFSSDQRRSYSRLSLLQ
ncbi:MAG: hypothetical protein ABSG41_11390 [Bryobacteraceae bacterium]|jgi:hypothetical protein